MSEENKEESTPDNSSKTTVAVTKEQAESIKEILAHPPKSRADLEAENEFLKKQLESQGGTGTLPNSLNGGSEGGVSDTIPEKKQGEYEGTTLTEAHMHMIDDLRNRGDKATIKKFWGKTVKIMADNKLEYTSQIVTDEEGNVIDSPIKRQAANILMQEKKHLKGIDQK